MSRFVGAVEAIELALLGNDDILQRGKGRMLRWAKYVYDDLQMSVIRQPIREEFKINKKTNTINLPCESSELCSVGVRDHHGVIWPMYRNDKLSKDIPVIPSDKDCNCEYNCGFKLCNTIKGYEAVQTVVSDFLPNMTPISFTAVNRKSCDRNGFVYEENQFIERVYQQGVWTDTILQTESKKLCQCEVDNNGCICDTEDNAKLLCNACGLNPSSIPVGGNANCPPNPKDARWIYYCNSALDFFMVQCGGRGRFKEGFHNIYNVSELGNQLQFPHHFGFDKVVVRYYAVPNLRTMVVPFIAVDAFVSGLKWWDVKWNDKKQALEQKYGMDYVQRKDGLFQTLNMGTLADAGMLFAPPRHIPSYVKPRWDEWNR